MSNEAIADAVIAAVITGLIEFVAHVVTMKWRGNALGRIASYSLGVGLFMVPFGVWTWLHSDLRVFLVLCGCVVAAGAGTVIGHWLDDHETDRQKAEKEATSTQAELAMLRAELAMRKESEESARAQLTALLVGQADET